MADQQLQLAIIVMVIALAAVFIALIVLVNVLKKLTALKQEQHQVPAPAPAPAAAPVLNQVSKPAPVLASSAPAVPKAPAPVAAAPAPVVSAPVVAAPVVPAAPVSQGISGEILAVIAAAAYTVYGVQESAIRSVTVLENSSVPAVAAVSAASASVRPSRTRSAWASAGVLENTRSF